MVIVEMVLLNRNLSKKRSKEPTKEQKLSETKNVIILELITCYGYARVANIGAFLITDERIRIIHAVDKRKKFREQKMIEKRVQ